MREVLRASFHIEAVPGHWRRVRSRGKQRYPDPQTEQWEKAVAWHVAQVWRGAEVARHCPVAISISFVWPWPSKSLLRDVLKARGLSQRPDRLLNTSAPDIDNAVKAILDGVNKARRVWGDDCQVAQLGRIQKWWSTNPQTAVSIYEVDESESLFAKE